jgi:hypothetical protein
MTRKNSRICGSVDNESVYNLYAFLFYPIRATRPDHFIGLQMAERLLALGTGSVLLPRNIKSSPSVRG